MSDKSQISLSLSPGLAPGEKVLYFKPILWAVTGRSLPSYRVSFSCPPIQEVAFYLTDRRVLLPGWVFRIFRIEWSAWFAGSKTADQDYVEVVSIGRNRLLGPYLEIITRNPVQHWWRSEQARIRLFMKDSESVGRLMAGLLAPSTPGGEPFGAADAGFAPLSAIRTPAVPRR